MNYKEYRRLAKISLKSRKKTTRSTVRGIVFGLILLIPIIFLSMGIYGGISTQINENPELIFANVPLVFGREGGLKEIKHADGTITNAGVGNIKNLEAIKKSNNVKEISIAQVFSIKSLQSRNGFIHDNNSMKDLSFSYSIDGDDFYNASDHKVSGMGEELSVSQLSVFDMKNNNNEYLLSHQKSNVFVEGMNKGFTGNGRHQVILSEVFIRNMGLNPSDVYGKKISFNYDTDKYNPVQGESIYLDNDNNPDNVYENNLYSGGNINLFSDYEVVGIVDMEFTKKEQGINNYFSITEIYGSGIWLTEDSLVNDAGEDYPYKLTSGGGSSVGSNAIIYTRLWTPQMISENGSCTKLDFCGVVPINASINIGQYDPINTSNIDETFVDIKSVYIAPHNYQGLTTFFTEYASLNKEFSPSAKANDYASAYGSKIYTSYSMITKIFSYVALAFIIFGGIILFAALVNMFNSIMHSVNLRKNYLGVMRAIGARDKVIPKLYIAETLTIFNRSMIWIGIIATVICVIIKILIDQLMRYTGDIMGVSLSISWWYIPITIAIVMAVLYSIGLTFAVGCSRRVSKLPITEVLSRE